ncbi:hypothetical protein UB46_03515 [Burkholderiaceae bacterium 16]|nr:hypothetical protein UB46_03515 [Burkholderiaceae bacterium 16]
MISKNDYDARGWDVLPVYSSWLPDGLENEMKAHPEAAGESAVGTRNLLFSLILSMRPKSILEIGAHIGSGSVVMGAALRANGFGNLYCLEPADHYFKILNSFVDKAGVAEHVQPLKLFSTDRALLEHITEPLDMIFLDANHTYSHALADIKLSDQLLAANGILILDDVGPVMSAEMCKENNGGVRQALIDYASGRDDLQVIFLEPPFWLNPCGIALVTKQAIVSRLAREEKKVPFWRQFAKSGVFGKA